MVGPPGDGPIVEDTGTQGNSRTREIVEALVLRTILFLLTLRLLVKIFRRIVSPIQGLQSVLQSNNFPAIHRLTLSLDPLVPAPTRQAHRMPAPLDASRWYPWQTKLAL